MCTEIHKEGPSIAVHNKMPVTMAAKPVVNTLWLLLMLHFCVFPSRFFPTTLNCAMFNAEHPAAVQTQQYHSRVGLMITVIAIVRFQKSGEKS